MIENLRKYRGLLIFGLAIVIIGLVIGMKDDVFRRGGGESLFRINGRTYGLQDYQRLGASSQELAYGLAQAGDMSLFGFVMSLSSGSGNSRDDSAQSFFTHRMVLRDAMEEYGVHPGDEEISARIREFRAFAGEDQKFDEARFRDFINKRIGHMGLTEGDLRALAADIIGFDKLQQIVGGGLAVNRAIVARETALQNQQISGHIARLEQSKFEEAINPSDVEIKTFWEVIQDAFRTEEKRDYSYVLITPNLPKEEVAAEKDKETLADAAASEEAKKQKAAEKTKKDAEIAETRRTKQLETDEAVDNFVYELEQRKGADFDTLAKENGWEVKSSGLFAAASAPPDLAIALRGNVRGGNVAAQLFQMKITADPLSKISQPLAVGEGQWLIARFEKDEPSRTKTFEEAKAEARDKYIQEKAREALIKAADEALAKIKTATAAGKTFADAAKEAGIAETSEFKDLSRTTRVDPATQPRELFTKTAYLDPGAFAEALLDGDRAFLVQVLKREVVKETDTAVRTNAEIESAATMNSTYAMQSWLKARTDAAEVQNLARQ